MSLQGTMTLPQRLTDDQLELGKIISLPWKVMPPRYYSFATDGNGKCFSDVAWGVHRRIVQNVDTVPIYYRIGDSALDTPPDYAIDVPHGILPGCTIPFDGTGGLLDASAFPYAVYLWNPTGGAFKALLFSSYHPGITPQAGQLY